MKCLFPASSILCGDVITVSIEVEEVEEEPGNKRRTALKRREGGGRRGRGRGVGQRSWVKTMSSSFPTFKHGAPGRFISSYSSYSCGGMKRLFREERGRGLRPVRF